MITVYFETENHGYAEVVAIFDAEDTYHACLPALEELAKKNRFAHITESVEEEKGIGELLDKVYHGRLTWDIPKELVVDLVKSGIQVMCKGYDSLNPQKDEDGNYLPNMFTGLTMEDVEDGHLCEDWHDFQIWQNKDLTFNGS